MENLRNRVDIRLVRSDEEDKIRKLVASPLHARHNIFTNDLVGIGMHESKLYLNKPVYTGMTILGEDERRMHRYADSRVRLPEVQNVLYHEGGPKKYIKKAKGVKKCVIIKKKKDR